MNPVDNWWKSCVRAGFSTVSTQRMWKNQLWNYF